MSTEWVAISQLAEKLLDGWVLLEDGVVYVRVYLPGLRVLS